LFLKIEDRETDRQLYLFRYREIGRLGVSSIIYNRRHISFTTNISTQLINFYAGLGFMKQVKYLIMKQNKNNKKKTNKQTN
jgi:hypothetical protein